MIEPNKNDIGKGVVYTPKNEQGAITSFNDNYVFVRYKSQFPGAPGQATRREDLEWEAGE